MFKALFEFVDGGTDELKDGSPVAALIANIDKLPFLPELRETVKTLYGEDLDSLISAGRNRDIICLNSIRILTVRALLLKNILLKAPRRLRIQRG